MTCVDHFLKTSHFNMSLLRIDKRIVNRAGWPSGEWNHEPDRIHWADDRFGLDCLIVRNDLGALCGYVGVPVWHLWYGKPYESIDVEVHGGLTYSDNCAGHICHTAEEAANDPVWWLGFDCGHAYDLIPGLPFHSPRPHEVYKNWDYVMAQCASLAEQAASAL